MRILVVTAHDAVNLSIENIVREFVKRGHEVEIYALEFDYRHIRMFIDLGIPIKPISSFMDADVVRFDCAFCPMDAVERLMFFDIYIFSYNFIFTNRWTSAGGDFMFIQTENRPIANWEDCARMAVGSPKNDFLPLKGIEEKIFLYIDTGHYPFGYSGKLQIAETLISICHNFPDYELVVKPRWLPDEKNHVHLNRIHLYNVLDKITGGVLPKNLRLLYEHQDMNKLIDRSKTVILPGSTSYLDVAMRGKNFLILDGFSSEDTFDLRIDKVWNKQIDEMRGTGCVIDYRQVLKYLPDGRRCREEYLDNVVAFRSGVSNRVVDVVEHIFEHILSKNFLPKITNYNFENYVKMIEADLSINFDIIKRKRMKNKVLTILRGLDYVSVDIDCSKIVNCVDDAYNVQPINDEGLKSLNSIAIAELHRQWIEHADALMNNDIDQSFLLQAYYDSGCSDVILKFSEQQILCKGPYHYYMGVIYSGTYDTAAALEEFSAFLMESNDHTYRKYIQESDWGIRRAYNYIFRVYDGKNIAPEVFAGLYIDLYEQRNPAVVSYGNLKRAHNMIPKIAEQLAEIDQAKAFKCLQLYAKYEYHYNIRERNNQINDLKRYIADFHSSKTYRWSQAVKWPIKKVKGGIRCLKEHGWNYTCHRVFEQIKGWFKSKISNTAIYSIWDAFHQKVMRGYALYEKVIEKYGENAYLVLSSQATGDVYMNGMCFKSHIKSGAVFKNSVPIFGVWENSGVTIASLFSIPNVEAFSLEEFKDLYNLLMFDSSKLCRLEHMHHHVLHRHTAILMHLEGPHQFNIFSLSKAYLGIESEEELTPPKFDYDYDYLQKVFQENDLVPGKTVMLAPYAKCVRPLPIRFWEELAKQLMDQGFTVCTNSVGKSEPAIKHTAAVFISHQKSVPFLEMAGATVGLRSGFQDVTSTAKCLKISLQPQINYKRGIGCTANESYNLQDMYHQEDQYDLDYSPEEEQTLLNDVLSLITNHFGK